MTPSVKTLKFDKYTNGGDVEVTTFELGEFDVTDRMKEIQKEIKERNKHFRAIYERLLKILFIVSIIGSIIIIITNSK